MSFTNEEIVARLRAKDPEVFRYLHRKHAGMIAGHVRKNSGNDEDAREMVQITFLELWNAVKEGRYKEEGKLERYIFQLAANNWRYELRRRRNRPASSLEAINRELEFSGDEELNHAIVKDRYLNAIHEALDKLGQPCQDIIRHYHLQEVSLQDIAAQMQYDYNNLRKRIFDCRKKLKTLTEAIISHVNQ